MLGGFELYPRWVPLFFTKKEMELLIQAIRRGEWRHFTITELKERKYARVTSEEKTHETVRMSE